MIRHLIKGYEPMLLICIAISLALYMTAAWKSAIYLHPDEYYQIVEFASYKMHITQSDQMAWEFEEKIRPAAQPLMCYTLLKSMNAVHITDHYTQLYLLRVISALFSLFAITLFCISGLSFVSDSYKRFYIAATYLFWYPYTYGVHFSSEAWSGALMLIAVSLVILYYQSEKRNVLLSFSLLGLILGFGFLLRMQTAFMSVGIIAWLFFEKKERANILIVIGTGASMLALGTVIDYWFYGEWVCTPYRYFDLAFVHKHTEFGTKPFYFYLLLLSLMLTPPIGLLIVVAVLVLFYTQPLSIYTWVLLPFLLLHTIISHKEFRFMYPVMSFFPLVVILAYQGWKEKQWRSIPKALLNFTKGCAIVFNALCLLIFVFFADRFLFDSKIFLSKIHELSKDKKVVIYCKDINNSPYILPKASIPKDLFPEYMRDSNVINVLTDDLKTSGTSNSDTIKLIATNKREYWHDIRYRGKIIQRTLIDMAFVKAIAGDEAYNSILENTYYLIEY